ncbi:fungal-specific transcription factor domain-containing protein [Podospora australis]|uniref:Fungal-specific transcription factor domain-containing protein n=1 Tax=Podospora australis TaxID=1536484 RepID=A0AAN7AFZ1_9PEZI|nr:fungal-specific transcription factor domain-containing protein [Podospora australis]
MEDRITQQQFAPPAAALGLGLTAVRSVHSNALLGPALTANATAAAAAKRRKQNRSSEAAALTEDGGEGEGDTSIVSETSHTPRQQKKQRISRSCDQCHGKRMKCSGFKPCNNCTKKNKSCTYERPYIRGIARTPPPPPDNGATRNLAQPFDENGRELRDRSWALRACDLCRSQKMMCSGKLPCDHCFSLRVECTFKMRANQRHSLSAEQAEQDDAEEQAWGHAIQQGPEGDTTSAHPEKSQWRRVPQDIAPFQLGAKYADEETPPLAFLHKAWERVAQAYRTKSRYGAEMTLPTQPPPPENLLPSGDQPFDLSSPLNFPDTHLRWFDMQDKFQTGWTETFHFLHRPTVRAWLEKVNRNWTDKLPLDHELSPAKATIALMTMAIGSQFYDRPWKERKKQKVWDHLWTLTNGDQIFLTTIRLTDSEPGPPKLESVQARLLQTLYLLCTCRLNQAWYVFGNTVQMIYSLGLHRRRGRNRGLGPEIVSAPDYAKVQCEMRTFWSAFVLDKQIAIMIGRPCYFSEDAVDQVYPDPINDEDMGPAGPFRAHLGDCYMEALIEQAKVNKLIDRVLREVYPLRDIHCDWRLDCALRIGKEIDECKSKLPFLMSNLKPSMLHTIFRRQATLLRLAHCHAKILVYRPFITASYPPEGEKKDLTDSAIKSCVEAARLALNACVGLAREQDKRDKSHFHAIVYAHHVGFVAACVIFMLPHIRSRQRLFGGPNFRGYEKADPKLVEQAEKCITALAVETNRYSPGRRWAIVLEELRAEVARQVTGEREASREQQNGDEPDEDDQEDGPAGSDEEHSGSPNEQLIEDALRATFHVDFPPQPVPDQAHQPPQNGEQPPPAPLPVVTPRPFDKWTVTDWLDLDSAAFGPILDFDRIPVPVTAHPAPPPEAASSAEPTPA